MLTNKLGRAFALIALTVTPVFAHDQWKNGDPVPDWIKTSCCGKADAHRLTVDQVHHSDLGYYTISGLADFSEDAKIGDQVVIPSQDGEYWLFYAPGYNVANNVYCFFVPLDF